MGLRCSRLSVFLFAFLALAVVAPTAVHAATVTVINNDGPGEGFNDLTLAAPVGGNTGTTIGAQRLNAFQYAADIWGGLLSSSVTIRVGAQFNPLTCDATSAILGSAGPNTVYRDFSGAPVAATYYPGALANALHGSDLDGLDDISAQFSSTIGTLGCLQGSGWYYGLDSNPPVGKIDFVSVLLHELGHGLGFLTFVNLSTGGKLAGFNDTFMRNLEDHGAVPSDYPTMNDAQRVTASTHTANLHWTGANVRAASGVLSAGKAGDHVQMFAPNPQQPGSSVSHWDTALTPNQMMEPMYTGALHSPGLELPLFQDIGWTLLPATPPGTYALTVSKSGNGTGVVTSSPGGINCGATCSANFTSGASVSLTATPASGSTFAGWSGACAGTGACMVSMNSVVSVTATFGLPDDGFPSGGIPAGWIQPVGSNAAWVVATDTAYAGSSSLKSGVILDGQKSDLAYTTTFGPGNVTFARKVSSEANWDFLEFYIDGVMQNGWSGDVGWSVVSFPITAGVHTLLWRYMKDPGCCIGGSDAAWIDSVTFPPLVLPPVCTLIPVSPSVAFGAAQLFSASCSNAPTSYQWTVDGGSVAGTQSNYITATTLPLGAHTISVTASNAAGSGSASTTLTVITFTPPATANYLIPIIQYLMME